MFALAATGLLLRLTVRDRLPWLSILFYVAPLGVAAALLWGAVACLREPRIRRPLVAFALLITVAWAWMQFSFRSKSPSDDSIRVSCWNVARGLGGWDGVVDGVQKLDADVIVLVETDRLPDAEQVWKKAMPGRSVKLLPRGLTLIVQGEAGEPRTLPLRSHCTASAVDVTVQGQGLTIVAVDILSAPYAPRGLPLNQLAASVDPIDRPTIILGDFNTPPESVWFAPLRERFANAFEAAGSGYAATWPVPLPVLTLDQIWVDRSLSVESCRHEWSAHSDHRPVIATIRLNRPDSFR